MITKNLLMTMKNSLARKLILILILTLGFTNVYSQTCTAVAKDVPFTSTTTSVMKSYGGQTVTYSYAGSMPKWSTTTVGVCQVTANQLMTDYGYNFDGAFWLGFGSASTLTLNFSIPVNNVKIVFGGGGPVQESLTVATNGGAVTLNTTSLSCAQSISGGTITFSHVPSVKDGGFFIVNSPSNFTTLTVTHNGQYDQSGTLVDFCLQSIAPSCLAGTNAPTLSATTNFASNTYTIPCGSNTANLSGITASNNPGTLPITYHSATPATNANKLSSSAALGVGTYYAAFYDATNTCYSPTTAVTVTKANCLTLTADSGSSFNATVGTASTTASVIANDTNNGSPVTLGASGNSTLTWQTAAPTGFTLNADGTISIAATATAGTYTINYRVCDKVVASNCKDSSATVVVSTGTAPCNAGTVAPTVN